MKLILMLIMPLALMATPLKAEQFFEKLSTAQLEQIFKEEGYSFTVDKDGDIKWKLEGRNAIVVRQSEGECITFQVGFKNDGTTTLAKINDWNRTKRYAKSYLNKDGDPILQADLDLAGGVTRARIVKFLATCRLTLTAWSISLTEST